MPRELSSDSLLCLGAWLKAFRCVNGAVRPETQRSFDLCVAVNLLANDGPTETY